MFNMFDLFVSSQPHLLILISLGSYALANILASLHHHILMLAFICLYPCILTSSYRQVHCPSFHLCTLTSLGSCALACNLVSSHPFILTLMYSICLLISSHPHILNPNCSKANLTPANILNKTG